MDTQKNDYKAILLQIELFHEIGCVSEKVIKSSNNWKHIVLSKLFYDSNNLVQTILSNCKHSKYSSKYSVYEPLITGALGRILQDIYTKVIYLKTNKYSSDEMQNCWSYQIINRQLELIKFENVIGNEQAVLKLQEEMKLLKPLIKNYQIDEKVKNKILEGREEKMLSTSELSQIYNFNSVKFNNYFIYFSQFSHSSAFSTSFYINNDQEYYYTFSAFLQRIGDWYVGILCEAFDFFKWDSSVVENYDQLQNAYLELKKKRWT